MPTIALGSTACKGRRPQCAMKRCDARTQPEFKLVARLKDLMRGAELNSGTCSGHAGWAPTGSRAGKAYSLWCVYDSQIF